MEPPLHDLVRFGAFELDPRSGELRKGRRRLHLQPQPFRVLSILVSRAGQLVTREELQHQLWDGRTFVDFEQGLNVCIRRIRAALHDDADAPRFVETVPRRGYRFIAPRSKIVPPVDSLAVLPFENASEDPDLEYLCDGIAESLINSLSQVEELRVVSRGTAFRYKHRTDLAGVRHELNIRAVVTGRVVLKAGSVNVQAELSELSTDSQLWGGHYHRKLCDIFEVQEQISREICHNLRLRLSGDEARRLRKRYTQNAEAYQLYLKGRYCSEKRTEEGLRKSITYFHQAIEKDSAYALAYAGLADSYALLGSGTYGILSTKNAMATAKAMAVKAIAMDDSLAEAHTSLAFVSFRFGWTWSDAGREFERAIKLNPRYARGHHWYALFLAAMGRQEEALDEIAEAQKLDPLASTVNTAEGRILHFGRRYDQAIEQFRKVLEFDPTFVAAHFDLAASYEQKLMFQEALTEFNTCVALSGGNPLYLAAVGEAYAHLGRRDEALKIIRELQEGPRDRYVSPSDIALIHIALGDNDEAFSLMEKAYEQCDGSLVWSKVAPEVDPLRSDPRFQDLLHRMDLLD